MEKRNNLNGMERKALSEVVSIFIHHKSVKTLKKYHDEFESSKSLSISPSAVFVVLVDAPRRHVPRLYVGAVDQDLATIRPDVDELRR